MNTKRINPRALRLATLLCFALFVQYGFSIPYSLRTTPIENGNGRTGIIWNSITTIDIDSIINSDSLKLFLDNEEINVGAIYSYDAGIWHYTHYSSLDGAANLYLSILDDYISGYIITYSGNYSIQSLSHNQIIIAKRIEEEISNDYESLDVDNYSEDDGDFTFVSVDDTPIIRVLFLYTDSVWDSISHTSGTTPTNLKMISLALTVINQANESFVNSNIDAQLELAYLGLTHYNESQHSWNNAINHFCQDNDGFMDEVHALRTKYAADVCVLLFNKSSLCGKAKTIKANYGSAFCIMYPSYGCTTDFTAAHEIGHLIGCRHNYSQDVLITPYMYGHGYVHYVSGSPPTSWRTIMSYSNDCGGHDYQCHTIPYWSNPNIYYNGLATGTTDLANNARVWNERAGTVAAFTNTPNSISYTSADNNTTAIFESINSLTQITLGNGFEIQSGQMVEMKASDKIILGPNTLIKQGAQYYAGIETNISRSNTPSHGSNKLNVQKKSPHSARKILRDGQLFIEHDGMVYTVTGQEVR